MNKLRWLVMAFLCVAVAVAARAQTEADKDKKGANSNVRGAQLIERFALFSVVVKGLNRKHLVEAVVGRRNVLRRTPDITQVLVRLRSRLCAAQHLVGDVDANHLA